MKKIPPRFREPVTVVRPTEADVGAGVEETFTAIFEALSKADANALEALAAEADAALAKAAAADDPTEKRAAALEADRLYTRIEIDYCRRVLVGWDEIEQEDGTPVPFDADEREALIFFPWFRAGVREAYARGVGRERVGN